MRPTTDAAVAPVEVDLDDGHADVLAFRTPEGETVIFEGATEDEVRAKADDFLAWAS